MSTPRSDAEQRVAALLHTARKALGMSLAFTSTFDGDVQVLNIVDASSWLPVKDGTEQVRSTSICQVILDGDLPAVLPDLRDFPLAMSLPAARMPRIRSYISIPIRLSDGSFYGTFCAAGLRPAPELGSQDQALMEVLAHAAALILEPEVVQQRNRLNSQQRFGPLLAAGGPRIVFQPIVTIADGARIGVEALSRFPPEWELAPDAAFEQAHALGLGDDLERLAMGKALRQAQNIDGYCSVNVSPRTLIQPATLDLLSEFADSSLLIELSEHDQVTDYPTLITALQQLRELGARLAIDDVGSGYSSLKHVLATSPEVLKLDRSMVTDVATDDTKRLLIQAIAKFALDSNAMVVAEGVETRAEADTLLACGVSFGQGWLFGRPLPIAELA